MIKDILYGCLFLITLNSFSQKTIIEDLKQYDISVEEYKVLLQESLKLNHIDYFFSGEDKLKSIVILKSQYIAPIVDEFQFKKNNKPIKFKTYKEIYTQNDLNFIDIMEVFIVENKLTISYGFYRENFAVFAEFIKCANDWELITKDIDQKPKTIVNLALTKGVCLSQLLKCKKNKNGNEEICIQCLEKYPNLIK